MSVTVYPATPSLTPRSGPSGLDDANRDPPLAAHAVGGRERHREPSSDRSRAQEEGLPPGPCRHEDQVQRSAAGHEQIEPGYHRTPGCGRLDNPPWSGLHDHEVALVGNHDRERDATPAA